MPDHDTLSAPALYRRAAGSFDLSTAWLEPYRRRAVSQLRLQPGEVVADVGCGTGLSFAAIQAAIGPTGRLVGIEPSPEMLAAARARVADAGWDNVTLLEAAAEDAVLPEPADAVLFAFTHDVVRSPEALANVLKAQEAAKARGESPARYLLTKFTHRLRRREEADAQRVLKTITTKHMREPGIEWAVFTLLAQLGLIEIDPATGRPVMTGGPMPGGMPVPGAVPAPASPGASRSPSSARRSLTARSAVSIGAPGAG